jgi:acyl carrier protein
MNIPSVGDVRSLILNLLEPRLLEIGMVPENAPDDLDLLSEGIIDSMGILEIILAVEERFGTKVDFSDLPPEELTIIGPFCRYVVEKCGSAIKTNPQL